MVIDAIYTLTGLCVMYVIVLTVFFALTEPDPKKEE